MYKHKEPRIYKLTEKDISSMKLLDCANKVLVRIDERNVDRKTPNGILMISECDMDWNPSEHHDRKGTVVHHSRRLKRLKNHLWKTRVEVQSGDQCWFDVMTTAKGDTIITEKFTYKLIDYFDLHVVKRGNDIICLNGYSLFDLVEEKIDSPLALITGKKDARLGILRYRGSCNEYYDFPGSQRLFDDERLQVGDTCVFSIPPVLLESEYHALFDGNQYRISQLHYVMAFIRDDIYATKNHAVLIPEITEKIGGIYIPNPKPSGFGVVHDSPEIPKGTRVYYDPINAIDIKDKHIINVNSIYYETNI